MLNYELLIACILIVISLVLYLFYWNRLLSAFFNVLLRVWGWNAGASSMWVEFGSIHFSLLRGRILVKGLRVHTSDFTARIVTGQVEWRYWIRRPMQEEDLAHQRASGPVSGDSDEDRYLTDALPCRIQVKLRGLECYMHNRIVTFDHIVSEMEQRAAEAQPPRSPTQDAGGFISRIFSKSSGPLDTVPVYPPSSTALFARHLNWLQRVWVTVSAQLPTLDLKDLLPIGIEIAKAVVICGNGATRSVLIFEFQRADGVVGIVPSRSKLDQYKQIVDLKLHNVASHFAENKEYEGSMVSTGERVKTALEKSKASKMRRFVQLSHAGFAKIWRRMSLVVLLPEAGVRHPRTGPIHTATQRMLRAFKRHDTEVDDIDYTTFEYAVERKWLEAPELDVSYYADQVGIVDLPVDGVELDPEWGVDIILHSGSVKYGPWADRQRADLQKAFFPSTFSNARPAPKPSCGDKRAYTALKVFIELRGGTSVDVPFREPSKNWQWDKKSKISLAGKRDAAHMTIKAADGSTISYHMPMFPSADGYEPVLEVHLDSVSLSSSLNDMRFADIESCRVRASMPSPLNWKASRQWDFMITLRAPVMYLLRDHINMFTDLAKDWSSGPAPLFHLWVPMNYSIRVDLWRYRLNLYANDLNIIDTPLLKDSNVIFTLRGETLKAGVKLPSDVFDPSTTTIPFSVEVPVVDLDLHLPRWNTNWADGDRLRGHIARLSALDIQGSYMYHAQVAPRNSEQLELRIAIDDLAYKAFGWTMRSLMVLRDNYLGGFTHYQTLSEFLDKLKRNRPVGDPMELQYRPGSSNPLQVLLLINCKHSHIALPAGLSGYEMANPSDGHESGIGSCAVLDVSQFKLSLRTNSEFMEMSINVDMARGHVERQLYDHQLFSLSRNMSRQETIVIDNFSIVTNRLFGPQPQALAYVCIWELGMGDIKTSLSFADVQTFISALEAFQYNFTDLANAPASGYLPAIPSDATFVILNLQSLHAVWNAGQAVAQLCLPKGLRVHTNNVAGKNYGGVVSVAVPIIDLRVLLRSPNCDHHWSEAAHALLDLGLDIYSSPQGWEEVARQQRQFLEEQDASTGRFASVFAEGGIEYHRRAIVRNGLYLPRLLPPLSHLWSRDQINHHSRNFQPLQHSPQPDGSDSDNFTYEVDWDAHLASHKPSYTVEQLSLSDDGGSMSGGDESDDTDFIDAEESDAEFADGSRLRNCAMSEQYASDALDSPSLWVASPFHILKHVRYVLQDKPSRMRSPQHPSKATNAINFPPRQGPSAPGRSMPHIHVDFVDVVVYPTMVSALETLLTDLDASPLSPELRLDAAMVRYIKSFGEQKASNITFLSFSLSSFTARCLQNIAPDSRTTQQASASSLELAIHNLAGHVRTDSVISTGRTVSASFDDVTLALSMAQSNKSDREKVDVRLQDVLRISLQRGHVAMIGSNWDLRLGSGLVYTTHAMPELLFATGVILAGLIKEASSTWTRHRIPSSHRDRALLLRCIAHVCCKQLVDQLSTTQPSYLVQSGAPRKLRADIAYKLLLYMRSCMPQLSDQERSGVLNAQVEESQTTDIQPTLLLLSRQAALLANDAEHGQIAARQLWATMFPELTERGRASNDKRRPFFLQFNMTSFLTTIVDPDARAPSSLSIGCIAFSAGDDYRTVTVAPVAQTAKSVPDAHAQDVHTTRSLAVTASIESIHLHIFPHLLDFVRVLAHSQRVHSVSSTSTGHPPPDSDTSSHPPLTVEASLALGHISLQAAADTLSLETGLRSVTFNASMIRRPWWESQPVMMTVSLCSTAEEAYFRALSTAEVDARNNRGVLASLVVSSIKVNTLYRQQELVLASVLRAITGFGAIELRVPRSALRLYHFLDEWQQKYFPRLEATTMELLSEIRSPQATSSGPSQRQDIPSAQVQIYVGSLAVALHVMRGTWFSWQVRRILVFGRTPPSSSRGGPVIRFGVKLAAQTLGIAPTPDLGDVASAKARVKLDVPTILIMGRYDRQGIYTLASMDLFQVTIKPSHLDAVLTVQQKFGQDFNDLIALVQHKRMRAAHKTTKDVLKVHDTPDEGIRYSAFIKMKGLRIGLRGPHATLYLECEDIGGGTNNELGQTWQMHLTDAALSFAPRGELRRVEHGFDRNQRSAFVVIDLTAHGEQPSNDVKGNSLKVHITKVHAVLRPTSLAEIGDFVSDLQLDLRTRQEKRAAELAEFKAKTTSILRAFDVNASELRPPQGQTLLNKYIVSFHMRNIGAAFPLTLDPTVQSSIRQDVPSRAFLLSVTSISFGARLGESGQMSIKGLSIQFVPSFRPSVFTDYSGETHFSHNRMVYPEMTAQLRTERIDQRARIHVRADVSGFVVDVDSSLPDYVFSLTDVYLHGKRQLDRIHGTGLVATPSTSSSLERVATSTETPADSSTAVEVCASLLFKSGQIRLHNASDIPSPRGRTASFSNPDASLLFSESDGDVIRLPELSVWLEYHAGTASQPAVEVETPGSVLLVKSTIHSSRNVLYPAKILPFLSEFNSHFEQRAATGSKVPKATEEQDQTTGLATSTTPSGLRISVCLQIDKSALELTCHPDVNVSAGLHWESGGFVLNMTPGVHQMAISGAVDGLAVKLQHGFLTDACATVETRGMTFSASYTRSDVPNDLMTTASVLVDTELVGSVRFSRLQDLLCFKAVWLDRIPVFTGPNVTPDSPIQAPPPIKSPTPTVDRFLTALCIRLRRLNLDVDLGQSISTIDMDMRQVLIQTRLTQLSSRFSLRVNQVNVTATGNVSGRADVVDFVFRTTRMTESAMDNASGQHQMLKLDITSGALNMVVESEHQKLLEYRAEPVQVSVSDDWSDAHGHMDPIDRELRLNFLVSGTAIAAAITVSSIPRLVTYFDKFMSNLQLQREGASRESQAFRIAQAPKPDNALSAVAEAMLQSARDRFQEAEATFAYVIHQGVDLRLEILQLAVFPRRMDDSEMAQFTGRQVQAYLERVVEPGSDVAKRHLRLSFSNMSVSRFSQLNQAIQRREPPSDTRDRLSKLAKGAVEANIFGLPAMTMRMTSEEYIMPVRTLSYDFESNFQATQMDHRGEDIYISLNVSLYAWLTFLRKNFARDMEEARIAKQPPSGSSNARDLPLISLPSPISGVDSPASILGPSFLKVGSDEAAGSPDIGRLSVIRPAAVSRTPSGSSLRSPQITASSSGSGGDFAPGSPDATAPTPVANSLHFQPRRRAIERLTLRQLGEATPDVMHPFFMKKAGFSLEDSLPQYVHEYATQPLEEIMKALLELYSKQLRAGSKA